MDVMHRPMALLTDEELSALSQPDAQLPSSSESISLYMEPFMTHSIEPLPVLGLMHLCIDTYELTREPDALNLLLKLINVEMSR